MTRRLSCLFFISFFAVQITPPAQAQQYFAEIIVTDLRLKSNASRLELNDKIEHEFQNFQKQTFNLTNTILSEINETIKETRKRIKSELGNSALQAANGSLNAVTENGIGGVVSCLNLSISKVNKVVAGILEEISKGFDVFINATEIIRTCSTQPFFQRIGCILERQKIVSLQLTRLGLNLSARVVGAVDVITNLQASFVTCVNSELMKVAIIVSEIALNLVASLSKV